MKDKHRLLVDVSSILKAMHRAGQDKEFGYKVKFEGKDVWVNPAEWGFENFVVSYKNLLKFLGLQPFQTILVKDGRDSRALRRALYPQYKAQRPSSPPELNEEYARLSEGIEDEILAMGGTVMVQDGMEADDVIAYLCENLEGRKTVWSRDGDMLALRSESTDIYLKDVLNPDIYKECPAQYTRLYKALVGDSSDNLPGAKGFGPKKFIELVLNFGYAGCDALIELIEQRRLGELIEDVAEFKPLQKILDNQEDVYSSYACAKFYTNRINTSREILQITTGMVQQWDPEVYHPSFQEYFGTKTLITADNFDQELPTLLGKLRLSPYAALDLEASDTDEGAAWAKAIDDSKSSRKSNTVDVFGQVMAGMSITFGSNLQHTIYCTVDHLEVNNCSLEQAKILVDALPQDIEVAVHNANYELPVLHEHYPGFWLPNVVDTADMCSHVDENLPAALKFNSKYYFNYDQQTYDETTCTDGPVGTIDHMGRLEKTYKNTLQEAVYEFYIDPKTGKERKKTVSKAVTEMWETRRRRMNELTAAEVVDYGCDDSIVTAALYNRLLLTMELEKTTQSWRECDVPASYWVAKAFVDGVPCDLEYMKKLELEEDATYEQLKEKLFDYLFDVNWDGCTYTPFTEITPATIKQAYLTVTGTPFDCMARLPEKIATALTEAGQPELADIVASGDLDALNEYMEGFFVPEPNFDVSKTAHVKKFLYEHLGVPIRFRTTPTNNMRANGIWEGTPQADFASVEHALKLDVAEGSREAEALLLIRNMTQINTRRGLYYKPYPLYAHWKDSRIHCNLGKNRTATRRFAPSGPNLNQLAKKGDGKVIRKCFRAPEGYVVMTSDWSGQELRLAAEESQDEMLLSCYIGDNKRDPHSLTGAGIAAKQGSLLYGAYEAFEAARSSSDESVRKVVGVLRDKGKGTNFSSQYLCQAPKLAKLLVVPTKEAQEFLEAKNAVYWGLAQWQQDTIAEAHAQGYVTTRMGARRHLHLKLSGPDKWSVMEAERQAVNFKIQGSGAEMTKRAINLMPPILERYGATLWFSLHDEFVCLVPIEKAVPCIQELHTCMLRPYGGMAVPLESDIAIGQSFGELVNIGTLPDQKLIEAALVKVLKSQRNDLGSQT